jgi:glycosyltransferase involved in cell wall biosynthesis
MRDRRPLVVDIGPLREQFYTGIPNVIAEICTRLLAEDWLDLYFDMDGRWIDNDSLRRCLEARSGASLGEGGADRFRPARAIRDRLRETGAMARTVGLYTDHRPPRKLYPREGKIVYDLSMILTPECHPPEAAGMYVLDLAEQIACSEVLFCISEATARDLAWIFGVGPDRLRVALLGNNVDLAAAARMRALIGDRPVEPFLLVLGSIEPRKNAALVLQWLAEHPAVLGEVRIVFAGRQAWGESFASLVAARGLQGAMAAGRIVFASFVDEAYRTALLVGAAGLIYPSVFEGFGLPLLEAMATGTPVLSSVSSSMPEVVGDCGYYFDPYSVASLDAAFRALWSDRASGAVEGVVARARARAAGFSYDRTYATIIEGLFKGSAGGPAGHRPDGHAPSAEPAPAPAVPDVDVIGYLNLALGVGEAGRSTLRALSRTGLTVRGLETSLNALSSTVETDCGGLLTGTGRAPLQVFVVNADQIAAVTDHLRDRLRQDAYRIIVPFWELAHLPDAWRAAYDRVDEVWAATRFMQTALLDTIAKPVIHMPLLLDFDPPPPLERSRFNLPRDRFLFFFAFDYLSFIERKNPQAVIAAFKRAFRHAGQTAPVALVLKTLNAEKAPAKAQPLRAMLEDDPDVILIEETLSRADTLGLVGACDAVVSLHRSEGLGLLVAEAMVLGKPVISTDYSATTELVTAQTGYPVEYRLIPVAAGEYPFHEGQIWADADVEHAAWQMRQVFAGGADVAGRVAEAKRHLRSVYGEAAVSRRQRERLGALGWAK